MNFPNTIDAVYQSTNLSCCINAAKDAETGKNVLIADQNSYFGGDVDSAFPIRKIASLGTKPIEGIQVEKVWHTFQAENILIDFGILPLGAYHPYVEACVDFSFSTEYINMMEVVPIYHLFDKTYYRLPLSKEDIFLNPAFPLFQKRTFMRILELGFESIQTLDFLSPLAKEMVLYGYCQFPSKFLAESANVDIIKSKLLRFHRSIGRFESSAEASSLLHSNMKTSPLLFPRYSNFEIVQAFIRKACVLGSSIMLSSATSMDSLVRGELLVRQDDQEYKWNLSKDAYIHSGITDTRYFDSCAAIVLSSSASSANLPTPLISGGATFSTSLFENSLMNILSLGHETGCTLKDTVLLYIWHQGPFDTVLSFTSTVLSIDISQEIKADVLGIVLFQRPHKEIFP